MAYHECGCKCGEQIFIPEEFAIGLLNLQKKYEENFITFYSIFKVGHVEKIISTIEKVNEKNED